MGDADIEMLADLDRCRADIDEIVGLAARQLHDVHGYSWGDIARVLGITRQSAHERFAVRVTLTGEASR